MHLLPRLRGGRAQGALSELRRRAAAAADPAGGQAREISALARTGLQAGRLCRRYGALAILDGDATRGGELLVADIAGVQCRGRFEDQNAGLLVGASPMF